MILHTLGPRTGPLGASRSAANDIDIHDNMNDTNNDNTNTNNTIDNYTISNGNSNTVTVK